MIPQLARESIGQASVTAYATVARSLKLKVAHYLRLTNLARQAATMSFVRLIHVASIEKVLGWMSNINCPILR